MSLSDVPTARGPLVLQPKIEPESKEEEEDDEIFYTPLEKMHLGPPKFQEPPAPLDQNETTEDDLYRMSNSKRETTPWLPKTKPLVIPIFLMLITPWRMTKYLFVPWFIGVALRAFETQFAYRSGVTPGILQWTGETRNLLEPLTGKGVACVLCVLDNQSCHTIDMERTKRRLADSPSGYAMHSSGGRVG